MANVIAVLIIAILLFIAIRYLVIQKKKGAHCIGCSSGECCKCKKDAG
ncbi:MAG: FeoB-associated Cys-rich membrane protein [Floccifex sp.]